MSHVINDLRFQTPTLTPHPRKNTGTMVRFAPGPWSPVQGHDKRKQGRLWNAAFQHQIKECPVDLVAMEQFVGGTGPAVFDDAKFTGKFP